MSNPYALQRQLQGRVLLMKGCICKVRDSLMLNRLVLTMQSQGPHSRYYTAYETVAQLNQTRRGLV